MSVKSLGIIGFLRSSAIYRAMHHWKPLRILILQATAPLPFAETTAMLLALLLFAAGAISNSTTLQTELNKQLARIALPDDDLIEKIDRELSKGKVARLRAETVI